MMTASGFADFTALRNSLQNVWLTSSETSSLQPSIPYSVVPEKDAASEDNGRIRVFMRSSGADSPRMIRMRLKASTGQWFIEEEMILSDIRIPKSMDQWA